MIVDYLSGGPYIFESLEAREELVQSIIRLSDVGWFDMLLYMAWHPPDDRVLQSRESGDDEALAGWHNAIFQLLSGVSEKFPDVALEKIVPLLEHDQFRGNAILIIGATQLKAGLKYLEAYVSKSQALSAKELDALAQALYWFGGKEARALLEELRLSVTDQDSPNGVEAMPEIIDILLGYWDNRASQS